MSEQKPDPPNKKSLDEQQTEGRNASSDKQVPRKRADMQRLRESEDRSANGE